MGNDLADRFGGEKMTIRRWQMRLLAALDSTGVPTLGGVVEAVEEFSRELREGSRE